MNTFESWIQYFTDQGVSRGLAITYIFVAGLIVLMAIVALVMWIIVCIKYQKGNKVEVTNKRTSFQVAEEALQKAGLEHIKVKQAGFFRSLFFGNCYSITKKTIFLRRNIADKATVTAVGLALQKVGIAKLCEEGNTMTRTRNVMQILSLFGPVLFIPVVLLGFVLDIVLFHIFGVFSIIGIIVGLILVLSGLISTLLSLPVEKKANDAALKIIDETNILTAEEREIIEDVFKAYIIAYVCDFIIAILRIVQIVLEIAINQQINSNRK